MRVSVKRKYNIFGNILVCFIPRSQMRIYRFYTVHLIQNGPRHTQHSLTQNYKPSSKVPSETPKLYIMYLVYLMHVEFQKMRCCPATSSYLKYQLVPARIFVLTVKQLSHFPNSEQNCADSWMYCLPSCQLNKMILELLDASLSKGQRFSTVSSLCTKLGKTISLLKAQRCNWY